MDVEVVVASTKNSCFVVEEIQAAFLLYPSPSFRLRVAVAGAGPHGGALRGVGLVQSCLCLKYADIQGKSTNSRNLCEPFGEEISLGGMIW